MQKKIFLPKKGYGQNKNAIAEKSCAEEPRRSEDILSKKGDLYRDVHGKTRMTLRTSFGL